VVAGQAHEVPGLPGIGPIEAAEAKHDPDAAGLGEAPGLGLGIETLPVASIGVGVGIDYGIYLIDRLKTEYQQTQNYEQAIRRAITTTGMAISFTATTLIAGIIFFYFFSNIRFQVEMSLLLSLLMFLNMVGALVLLPTMFYFVRPRFVRSELAESSAGGARIGARQVGAAR